MKYLFFILSVVLLSVGAMAQVVAASPTPAGSPVVVAVAQNSVGFIQFVMLHQALIAGALVALLDLAMALIPGLASNGILHAVYLFVKGIAAKSSSNQNPPAAS